LIVFFIFFLLTLPPPPRSTLFPYTTLFRSTLLDTFTLVLCKSEGAFPISIEQWVAHCCIKWDGGTKDGEAAVDVETLLKKLLQIDRKSTRLNSSHLGISYAVFCLKKKNNKK